MSETTATKEPEVARSPDGRSPDQPPQDWIYEPKQDAPKDE